MANGQKLKNTKREQIIHYSLFTIHYFLYLCTQKYGSCRIDRDTLH